ncbi:MAG TPA: hypothetical protein VFP94_08525, partial [Terriglobales bacterium]|nr:hypothetical protein [Terriglobales bacterium]
MVIALVWVGAAQQPAWSPAPPKFLQLKAGITPVEMARLRPALIHDRIAQNEAIGMGALPEADAARLVDHAYISRVSLGALGSGYLASFQQSPECGATGNCPMVLLSPAQGGGFVATDLFGWGFAAAPGPAPEIYSAVREGGSHSGVARMRWSGGKFVTVGEEETSNGETIVPEAGKPAFPLPRWGANVNGSGIERDLFDRIEPALLTSLERHMPVAAAQTAVAQAQSGSQSLPNGLRPIVVKTGACDALGNCPLFVFRSMEGSTRHPMILDGTAGWGIRLRFYNASLNSRELLLEATLARRIRADAVVLIQYREAPADRFGPDRLMAHGCETATGNIPADPAQWNPTSLNLTPGCGSAPAPRSAVRVDRTPIETVLRDGSGAVWGAAGTTTPCDGRLFRWLANRWVQQQPPNAASGLRAILPGSDGGVIAEWGTCGNAGSSTTWQRSSVTRRLPSGPWPIQAMQTPLGLIVPA